MRFALALVAALALPAAATAQNQAQMFGQTSTGASRAIRILPDGSLRTAPSGGAMTDASGTIATANTAQTIAPANDQRRYLFCQNPLTAAEPLLFDVGQSANPTTSIEIAAGGSILFSAGFVPTGAVTVRAATAGHRFICKMG